MFFMGANSLKLAMHLFHRYAIMFYLLNNAFKSFIEVLNAIGKLAGRRAMLVLQCDIHIAIAYRNHNLGKNEWRK